MKKLFALLFVAPLLSQNIPQYTPPNGLDLWYSFSNNTTDESGNNNNGTPYSLTPTTGRSGQPNTAYQFNGTNSKINISNPVLEGQLVDKFAFFFLFKIDTLTSYAQPLWYKQYPNFDLLVYIDLSGYLKLEYHRPDTISIVYPSNFAFQTNKWYDLVINFSNSQVDFYIDGSPVTTTIVALPPYSSWPLSTTDVADKCNFIQNLSGVEIGKEINYNFKGAIDEVGVWNRPLIECEIQSLHLSELQCPVSFPCTEIVYDTVTVYSTVTVYDTVTTVIYDTLFIATHQDESIFYVPNSFTPDDDSFNNIFQPIFTEGFDQFDFHLTIFNRWGETIFESYDASKGWNGYYGEKKCQDGVYTWKIEFGRPGIDDREVIVGHVFLIK
jgi:gliding motility-associated-like protein